MGRSCHHIERRVGQMPRKEEAQGRVPVPSSVNCVSPREEAMEIDSDEESYPRHSVAFFNAELRPLTQSTEELQACNATRLILFPEITRRWLSSFETQRPFPGEVQLRARCKQTSTRKNNLVLRLSGAWADLSLPRGGRGVQWEWHSKRAKQQLQVAQPSTAVSSKFLDHAPPRSLANPHHHLTQSSSSCLTEPYLAPYYPVHASIMYPSRPDGFLSSDVPDYDLESIFAAPFEFSLDFVPSSSETPSFQADEKHTVEGSGYSSPSADDVAAEYVAFEDAVPLKLPATKRYADEGQGLSPPRRDEVATEPIAHEGAVPLYFSAAQDYAVEGFGGSAPSAEDANDQSVEDLTATNATHPTVAGTGSDLPFDITRPMSPNGCLQVAQALFDSRLAHDLMPPSLETLQLPSAHDEYATDTEVTTTPTEYQASDGYYSPQTDLSSMEYTTPDSCGNAENVPPFPLFGESTSETTDARTIVRPSSLYHQPLFVLTTPANFAVIDDGTASHGYVTHHAPQYLGASMAYAYPVSTGVPEDAALTVGGTSSQQQNGRKRKGKEVEREEMDKPVTKKVKKIKASTIATTSAVSASNTTAEGSSAPNRTQKESQSSCSLAHSLSKDKAHERTNEVVVAARSQTRCYWPGCLESISTDVNLLNDHFKAHLGKDNAKADVVCPWPGKGEQPCGKTLTNGARGLARHLHCGKHLAVKFSCPECEEMFLRPKELQDHLEV
ncbi:hypothetical protein FB45DRAFT_901452 [Roridomyces roridus]|uniref:C2H2-type domain-containing protein n=1 Tax=Roridomyces roridus TaxID=1738132 RepID=A0AAD7C8Q5_9AGAR|nr:hypothetical protein FB45DRAFT_901452 [Roridomyces roridus]